MISTILWCMRHYESINASLQLESKLLLRIRAYIKYSNRKKGKNSSGGNIRLKIHYSVRVGLWHGLILRKTCMFEESRPASMFLHLALRTNSFRARVILHSATKFAPYSFLLSSLLFFMKYKSIDYIIIITDTIIAISTTKHIYRYYDRMTRNIYIYTHTSNACQRNIYALCTTGSCVGKKNKT